VTVIAALVGCSSNDQPDDDATEEPVIEHTVGVAVLDYSPMPGQFVNVIPPYYDGDDANAMCSAAQMYLDQGYLISLGSFGGSITLKVSEPIRHRKSGRDFRVLGNAFYGSTSTTSYGSAEPGIILVSHDDNGNGIADDKWYLIRGSEWDRSENVTVCYYAPEETADAEHYIHWTCSDGSDGYIPHNAYHTQPYFPQWVSAPSLTFTGMRLPDNSVYISSTRQYTFECYDYGYADTHPNTSDKSIIDISWAVDESGASANLTEINFIKIYTGVLQANSFLGESSTEVLGIQLPADEPSSRMAPVTGSNRR
jgi:hypothetical protein